MLEDQTMIKAIIFDLDNCLSAADEPGSALLEPVFDAIRQANRGTLPHDMLETALADCWYHALDFVAKKHGFSEKTGFRKTGFARAAPALPAATAPDRFAEAYSELRHNLAAIANSR
ncbi:hypothetical protein O77CONTIG1_01923 [Leptolyngbya sp. O-77]|nr:hypothetical protein O77CONTIG1_01923 [Leptolyngbya sp. O-77]